MLPAVESEFGTHAKHPVAPSDAEYVPAPQSMHLVTLLYFPATHGKHAVAPYTEYVPFPQSRQSAEPLTLLYFPGTHIAQDPPSGPM